MAVAVASAAVAAVAAVATATSATDDITPTAVARASVPDADTCRLQIVLTEGAPSSLVKLTHCTMPSGCDELIPDHTPIEPFGCSKYNRW